MRTVDQIQADIDEREARLAEMRGQLETDAESVSADEAIRLDTEVADLNDEMAKAIAARTALQRKERVAAINDEPGSPTSMFADLAADLVDMTAGGRREAETHFPVADLMKGLLLGDVITRPTTLPTGQVPVVAPVDVGRPTGLVDVIQMLPTESQTIQLPEISWAAGADVKDEGDQAGENTGVLSTVNVITHRIPVFMKVSVQSLRDVVGMQMEIQTTLMADARQKLDRMIVGRVAADQEFTTRHTLWGAPGTQQKGSADAAGDKVATLFQEYLNAAGDYGYEPNYVVMSRRAWGNLVATTKDTDNDAIFNGRMREFDGVMVIYTTALNPAKKMMIGGVFNPRTITLRVRANPMISVGMEADDMTKGLRTVLLDMEIACAVRGAPLFAIYKDANDATAWV